MTHRLPGILCRGRRFRWIFATIAMHLVKPFRLGVVRLQIAVADRPRWRDSTVMAQLAEIAFAEPKQRWPIEYRAAVNVVVGVRMQVPSVLVEPCLFRVVVSIDVDDLGIPVCFLARHIVSTLENEDALARGRQMVSQSASTGTGSDDDDVVTVIA